LGIDIGALDEVILIQSPPSIASALQRLGRAGHQVNASSRGMLYPSHANDILEAGVLVSGILEQDIEKVRPVECPLDVLAQIIISMTGTETWDIDRLYFTLKTSHPYHLLSREHFDLVLNMLAGRYADARIRELKARISIDRIDNTVAARKGALLNLYMSGGVIPNRGYFSLRHAENHARIGELDEEFVWEARIGQVFTLGNQNWKIERITHNDVLVRPTGSNKTAPPFWIAETTNRGFHLSEKIARFLTWINGNLEKSDLQQRLSERCHMDGFAAEMLIGYLERQKEKSECDLPHRFHLVIEKVSAGPGGAPGNQIVMHTYWGGQVNRPYAMALQAAWEETFGQPLETYADNNCICIILPHDIHPEDLLAMVTQQQVGALIRKRLEGSGFFGARFRECAGRALLITQNKVNERLPLWVNRLKSKKLYDAVAGFDDFPILLETWRTCLKDLFDIDNLNRVLAELESGEIQCSFISGRHPSPMAMQGAWRQINEYMYRDDHPTSTNRSRLREDLIESLLASPGFQPELPLPLIQGFERKRKRETPGYAPDTPRSLVDWVLERIMLPLDEWRTLVSSIGKESHIYVKDMQAELKGRLVCIKNKQTGWQSVAARENISTLMAALYQNRDDVALRPLFPAQPPVKANDNSLHAACDLAPEDTAQIRMNLMGEWLSFYGPMTFGTVQQKTNIEPGILATVIADLVEAGKVLNGRFTVGSEVDEICDKDNFSILLRMRRKDAVPVFEPREIFDLPGFVAVVQGVVGPKDRKAYLYSCFEKLACFCASAGLWESDILPARLNSYDTSWLDTAIQESDLLWGGCQRNKVYFCFNEDLDLLHPPSLEREQGMADHPDFMEGSFAKTFFNEMGTRHNVQTLAQQSGLPIAQVVERLWQGVWDGYLSNDTSIALRNGIESKFAFPAGLPDRGRSVLAEKQSDGMTSRRHLRRRSKRKQTFHGQVGNWYRLRPDTSGEIDLMETAELEKERVRLLLDRYGILFREILFQERPAFKWQSVFRALRLMELSGEIVSGYFFKEIPGPQFMSHSGFQKLQRFDPEGEVFWINAQDPASMCGLPLPVLKQDLPSRLPGSHLVYAGSRLVLTSMGHGRELVFNVDKDDTDIQSYLGVLRHLLARQFRPLKQITVKTINGRDAARSPYVDALRIAFDVMIDYKQVILYRIP